MKFRLYREFGALNSPSIFDAVAEGIKKIGHSVVDQNEDIAVIWSVLWHGRMAENRNIYNVAKTKKKPVMIIEVGNLLRGKTWRISVDNINRQGFFGNFENLDLDRSKKLGVSLKPENVIRKSHILVTAQHVKSLQWEGMPTPERWLSDTIDKIRRYSARPIVVRPHPRSRFVVNQENCSLELPQIVRSSYDDYDITYDCHCVINHCSGPTVQAAIEGTPVICDPSGLAYPVSEKWENLENLILPDREEWFLRICHTEYLVDEIAGGLPIMNLQDYLLDRLKTSS